MTITSLPTEALIEVRGLTHSFGKEGHLALDHLDAEIVGGKITGLVGPDGAGKTTFIRILAGLLLPSSGEVNVLGLDPAVEPEPIRERMGYMPQRFGLYEDLSVKQNLQLYADLRDVMQGELKSHLDHLLEFTDLKAFEDRKAGALSGGMKQKLGLACALVGSPELLLLDEPGVGVDPISRRELWKVVKSLVRQGIGVLWSTAYLDEAERCESVILLNEGKILFTGPPQELTGRVKGRTFHLKAGIGRRRLLSQALKLPSVIDGVVQGEKVRLVLRKPEDLRDVEAQLKNETARTVVPRFEDAYVDALGGVPKSDTVVAQSMRRIQSDSVSVIEATDLTKRFGEFVATDRVTFKVGRGEIFGLLGPNGAGKSTTFKMLCGLLIPSAGKARVAGLDLQHSGSAARSRIGYMAQKFSLYADLTARQNLDFFSGVYGLRGEQKKAAISRTIETFNLGPYLAVPSGQLPLGYKQRLAMGCALIHEPDVLFLDEPTSGVDPITRREFWSHINSLVEIGVTVLVTTHFMDEAEYCDRIGLVYRGQLIALGTPDELKRQAQSDERGESTMEDAFVELILGFDRDREGDRRKKHVQAG